MTRHIEGACRVILVSTFLFAAFGKLMASSGLADHLTSGVELVMAAWLLLGRWLAHAYAAVFALICTFTAYLLWRQQPECHCFGAFGAMTSPAALIRNSILALAAVIGWRTSHATRWPRTAVVGALALSLLGWTLFARLQLGRATPAPADLFVCRLGHPGEQTLFAVVDGQCSKCQEEAAHLASTRLPVIFVGVGPKPAWIKRRWCSVSRERWFRMIRSTPPRYILVTERVDGMTVDRIWDGVPVERVLSELQ